MGPAAELVGPGQSHNLLACRLAAPQKAPSCCAPDTQLSCELTGPVSMSRILLMLDASKHACVSATRPLTLLDTKGCCLTQAAYACTRCVATDAAGSLQWQWPHNVCMCRLLAMGSSHSVLLARKLAAHLQQRMLTICLTHSSAAIVCQSVGLGCGPELKPPGNLLPIRTSDASSVPAPRCCMAPHTAAGLGCE